MKLGEISRARAKPETMIRWILSSMPDCVGFLRCPQIERMRNRILTAFFFFSRRDEKEILSARFTEEDVLARGPVSRKTRLRQLVNQATGK